MAAELRKPDRWASLLTILDNIESGAPGGAGIRTHLIRGLDQALGDYTFNTRRADVETSSEPISTVRRTEVRFSVNGHIRKESQLHFVCRAFDRAEETGRPPSGEGF